MFFALTASLSSAQIALPVTFEEEINYEITDFAGTESELTADPTDASNTVVQTVRMTDALSYAGTTVAGTTGFEDPIPFTPDVTTMSVRVWTPAAGTPVRLKVENLTEGAVNVEAQLNSTVAGMWETLVFDFANEVGGTALDFDAEYTKVSIFFDFGLEGATAATTYYWDDLSFGGEATGGGGGGVSVVTLPVTFEEEIDYELNDFGGAQSQLVADPTDAENTVVESIRTAGAATFAGTTVADDNGFTAPIPFAPGATTMSVRVWTPTAGTPVRLKVENADDPTVSVEAQVNSTMSGMWETLVFDFTNEATGTAAINLASEYTKASIFFDFGLEGATAATTYYWDDLAFGSDVSTSREDGPGFPQGLRLAQNAPNPFSATTTISFSLPSADRVAVHVYNTLGQRVTTLVDGAFDAGDHDVTLDASGLASGTYIYRLQYGTASVTKSMVVVR